MTKRERTVSQETSAVTREPKSAQRRCRRCQQMRPVEGFGAGWLCGECRQAAKERRATYLSEWRKRNGVQASADWREQNPDYDRSYYAHNRERNLAVTTVAKAVREGRLPKAQTQKCFRCGGSATGYWHESLAKEDRLKVKPVCRGCHGELSSKEPTP